MENRDKLTLSTPAQFRHTNDIIGGIRVAGDYAKAEIWPDSTATSKSLVGDFVYDGAANRAVAVQHRGMTEALTKLYGASRLMEELAGNSARFR